VIRRRHVIFVEGYDPRGAESYYGLFQRASRRFENTWAVGITLGPLQIDDEDFAHWHVEARAPNWQVATRYDFLRQEKFIRADMAQPMMRQLARALRWTVGDLVSGATLRIGRASWRFALHLLGYQGLLLIWLGLALAAGLSAGLVADQIGLPAVVGPLAAAVAALAALVLLRPLIARSGMVLQLISCWPRMREFGRGQPTWLDRAVDAGARRLVAAALANETDELVVVGHSAGGITAPALVARALELDPDLGRRGPQLVLLTLGSVMPAAALDPAAARLREVVRRLALERSLKWIDCRSNKDHLNFWQLDPVEGIGVKLAARCNPLIWPVPLKQMLSSQSYARLKWSPFRRHFQFIMSGDRRASYDYLMLVAGPLAVADWACNAEALAASFASDGAFGGVAPADPADAVARN
jgi:hypothetical protein